MESKLRPGLVFFSERSQSNMTNKMRMPESVDVAIRQKLLNVSKIIRPVQSVGVAGALVASVVCLNLQKSRVIALISGARWCRY